MNDYKGFKSQALDFNVYSDGVSVSSVTQEYALAPEDPETSEPLYEIKEGEGENAVTIWKINWSDSPPPYTDYPTRIDSSAEITSEGKNVYWERQVTYYSDDLNKPFPGTPTKSTMLDVDFINSIGITAKKITVVDEKKNLVFEADSFSDSGSVKIGGFNVNSSELFAGEDTTKVIIRSRISSEITLDDIPSEAGENEGVYKAGEKTYVLLDYIESTGKEYIDLGLYAKDIATATVDFMYTGEVVTTGLEANSYNAVYGTDSGIQIARRRGTGIFTNGDTNSSTVLNFNTRYVCDATYSYQSDFTSNIVGTGTLTLYNHGQATSIANLERNLYKATTDSSVNNVYLFGAYDNDISGATYFSEAKIYSCKIKNSNSDSYDYEFQPVLQVDTGTIGFFDTKHSTFHTNQSGQGGFIAGPVAEIVPIEFISIALGAETPSQAPFSVTNKGEVTATKGNIGGFVIDTNTIASGDDTKKVGIRLTSTDGTNKDAKVIQAGTNFSVDADGKIVSTGGTIGGFEISPSRLFGGVTGTNENSKDRVVALYAPILPLEIDFSSTVGNRSDLIAFEPESATLDWTKCVDTVSGKTWGTINPSNSEVGTSGKIRRTTSWTSLTDDTLHRYFPRWKIDSNYYTISGITRDEEGIEQKDDEDKPLTTTGKTIENLLIGDVVAHQFYMTGTNLNYTTSAGTSGSIGVTIKKYIELQLRNSSNAGQIQYRFAIEIEPLSSSNSWVAAEYVVTELRAPTNWATDKSTVFTVTGEGSYITKTWSKTFGYTSIPGGSRTNGFTIYQITASITNSSSSSGKVDINNDSVSTGTAELGYGGNSKGYDYYIISLTYNNSSKEFTIIEEVKYIVNDSDPDPIKIKLTTDKYQDATGAECALIAGATATKTSNIWKVTPGTEALRIEHSGRLRLKDGLDFYQTGLNYSGTWGKESEKSWAASHNAGATTYQWWNTDKGGYSDYWKSFAQLGVNSTYYDDGGLTSSDSAADQSPATLFLAASTNATHTDFIFPKSYKSSAVIRAATTPSYDGKCTAEITLSRYNSPLSTSATEGPAARTKITPDGISTGYVQFNLPSETGNIRQYVIWSKDVTSEPRRTWNTILANALGFHPLVGWISYATSSTDITTAGGGSVLDNDTGVTTNGSNIYYWVDSITDETNKINRVTLTVIGYL